MKENAPWWAAYYWGEPTVDAQRVSETGGSGTFLVQARTLPLARPRHRKNGVEHNHERSSHWFQGVLDVSARTGPLFPSRRRTSPSLATSSGAQWGAVGHSGAQGADWASPRSLRGHRVSARCGLRSTAGFRFRLPGPCRLMKTQSAPWLSS